ncbi:MFS transporter [Kytococcus sedentarius]|uniref:Multidrug efflux pump Tap n=1 Tax=Kytococcus sedentarius (strain ATCC 14392 / DSM 20547 / JCM 11482 / CCUG 33030 / NBRC 15357 / NCTC 11040 / CCM 314 / 541) TaxID=478801 RepID=C7NJG5_KYTSD|nr:MFS transporter [Kytococcus sedentarius]ACV05295.1 Major Facilitator Superfamily transporter [Kytococcus sedentarius DSM 20547]STX13297.1 Probable multidrug-efflux transporter Rv1258c/MT1297 [Kytococcus sedentarius]
MSALPLRGLLTAETFTITATRMSMVVIPWFVLVTTGSATQTGLVSAAELLPLVVFKVLGGPLTDRLGPRRVACVCDLGSAAVFGLIPLLHLRGALPFWALLLLVAAGGALRGPADGAKQAMIPGVTELARVPLERVTGYHGAIDRGSAMAGAAAAGLLITQLGAPRTLFVVAACFVLGAAALGATTAAASRPSAQRDTREPYLRSLLGGWDFIRHDAVLLGISGMVAVTNLLDLAWSAVLFPVWARETGAGAAGISLLLTVFSAAATVSSLAAARWAHRLPRFRTYVIGFLVTGPVRFAVLTLGAPLWVVVTVFAVTGAASGFLNPILGAVIFERIPAGLTGRVSALSASLGWSLMPLGGLLGGLLASGLGWRWALWALAGAYLVATLAPLVVPSFREFDTRPAPPVLSDQADASWPAQEPAAQ